MIRVSTSINAFQRNRLSSKQKSDILSSSVPDFISDLDESTKKVEHFYNEILFPGYEDFENFQSLLDKGRKSTLLSSLDKSISLKAKVLELGCGTGQMSMYLNQFNREVIGADISRGSLKLANNFKLENELKGPLFCRCDVFDLPFKQNYFDVIITNGVLHHTKDPKLAFSQLCKHLKPNGFIVFGLYHKYGRAVTQIKKFLAPALSRQIKLFDKSLREMKGKQKRNAWLKDQFFNPLESTHTLKETLKWLKHCDLRFVNSLPFCEQTEKSLFSIHKKPDMKDLFMEELVLMFDQYQIREGGFFITIAQK